MALRAALTLANVGLAGGVKHCRDVGTQASPSTHSGVPNGSTFHRWISLAAPRPEADESPLLPPVPSAPVLVRPPSLVAINAFEKEFLRLTMATAKGAGNSPTLRNTAGILEIVKRRSPTVAESTAPAQRPSPLAKREAQRADPYLRCNRKSLTLS